MIAAYTEHDGLGLAMLVKSGQIGVAELLETAIARIEQHNPALNAVVRKRYPQAHAEAALVQPDAPFAGVPFLVKDLICTFAGEPTGSGNRLLATLPMARDSQLLRRFRAAGLLAVGRSSTPEFGLVPTTEPALYGATHNPWSLAHSPGGSSGGSAAAVAAGLVPLASGGDGGGSIRIPASCCGLFGFKPSRGLVPTGPDFGEIWQGLVTEHALTRSVRDSAALLDAIAGADAGAPYAAPARPPSYLAEAGVDPAPLRIAFTHRPLFGDGRVHADCIQGLRATAALLQSLGHHVEEDTPPLDSTADALAFVTVLAAQTRAEIEIVSRLAGHRPHATDFEPATYSLGLIGRALGAAEYAAAVMHLQRVARRLVPFFERHDVLLTPTLATPPPLTGALQPSAAETSLMRLVNRLGAGWLLRVARVIEPLAAKTFEYMPYTPMFNVTGQPAMSVPLHWSTEGLPIGMQFVGRFGEDALLLRLAGQLERAQPWFGRRPAGY